MTQLFGRYELVRELARGGMGAVYHARHLDLAREVALKVMLPEIAREERNVQRFLMEARALARLQHPNVVAVRDVGEVGGVPSLVMDLIEGESLKARLKRGPLEVEEAVRIVESLARALEEAHQHHILHRDIKPENVLLDVHGRPFLTDFGLARDTRAERERLTMTGEVLGTPAYMSPEQANGEVETLGPATDVYALGATLYALLTGQAPFLGATPLRVITAVLADAPTPPSAVRGEVDPALERICLTCLEKEPSARYSSAEELADALADYLAGGGEPPAVGGYAVALATACTLVLVAVGGALAVWSRDGNPPPSPAVANRTKTINEAPPLRKTEEPPAVDRRPGSSWVERKPTGLLPEPRDGHERAMVYDPRRKVVLMFGGWYPKKETYYEGLWSWDGTRWKRVLSAGPLPPPRFGHTVAFDERRGVVVLYGGITPVKGWTQHSDDLWEWDGKRWEQRRFLGGPGGRAWHGMTYDPDRGVLVLLGGDLKETPQTKRHTPPVLHPWEWNGSGWSQRVVEGEKPAGRFQFGLSYDRRRRRLVVYGGGVTGSKPSRIVWELGERWTKIPPQGAVPEQHYGSSVTWDGREVVLFGGQRRDGKLGNATWSWNGQRWKKWQLASAPPKRQYSALAFDPGRKALVVFAGDLGGRWRNDVWEYVIPSSGGARAPR